jgi:hypothetical protein
LGKMLFRYSVSSSKGTLPCFALLFAAYLATWILLFKRYALARFFRWFFIISSCLMVLGFMQQSGGAVIAKPEVSQGATFELYFPTS